MEYEPNFQDNAVTMILCCQCGTQIEPNPSNMCVACLRSEVDITESIPKQGVLHFCRNCERYLQPPEHWVTAQLESRELLSICLKRIKGLNKVHLIDAGFVWTEPHSMRIKVKLTVQKEHTSNAKRGILTHGQPKFSISSAQTCTLKKILQCRLMVSTQSLQSQQMLYNGCKSMVMNGAILQQVFIVEFTVANQMCDECHRVEAKDFWRAVVQVRQKADHKKTFYYLEQLILKHKAHQNTVNIKPLPDGLDFFYSKKDDGRKMMEFLMSCVPCKTQTAQELVSHDIRNNTFTYKHTFSVTIVPICKDNVVCLPQKLAASLGNINPICVCYRVTHNVHLIDPNTLQIAELSGQVYWKTPFVSLCSPKQLIPYMVMQVDFVSDREKPTILGQVSKKHVLADVWVARMSDMGMNDQQYFCRTHIGHLLNAGDTVLGFDMVNANFNNEHIEKLAAHKLPDVVIVKKVYGDRKKRDRHRMWKLRHLNDELHNLETDSAMKEYTDFIEDLEEDPTLRQNVNIYKDKDRIPVDTDDMDEDGTPQISLQEMIDDLQIADDATGAEGAVMID